MTMCSGKTKIKLPVSWSQMARNSFIKWFFNLYKFIFCPPVCDKNYELFHTGKIWYTLLSALFLWVQEI
jgi:hypothetical protein